jgi:ATP-dependent RNA helicase DeaD
METQLVADRLSNDGYTAEALNGDMLQEERDMVMKKFRAHRIQLLIATDVAARGIDVNEITHVIHYAIPDDYNTYAHRSGRTGRAGKTGISIVLIHMREQFKLERIEKPLGKKFKQKTLPIGSEITRIRLLNLAERIRDYKVDPELLENNLELMCSVLNELSKEEIIQRIALMEQQKTLQYYKDMPELSTEPEKARTKSIPSEHKSGKDVRAAHVPRKMTLGMIELVINIGKINGLTPLKLKELINKSVPGRYIELGRINIVEKQTYFEVPYVEYNDIVNHFLKNPTLFADRKLNVVSAGNAKPFAPPLHTPKGKGFYNKKKRPPKRK